MADIRPPRRGEDLEQWARSMAEPADAVLMEDEAARTAPQPPKPFEPEEWDHVRTPYGERD